MPWKAVPLKGAPDVAKSFNVTTIPRLMVLRPEGGIANSDAVQRVVGDPEGKDFPWEGEPSFWCVLCVGCEASPHVGRVSLGPLPQRQRMTPPGLQEVVNVHLGIPNRHGGLQMLMRKLCMEELGGSRGGWGGRVLGCSKRDW